MFLGHFGAAFALKRLEPKLSLGTLFLAVQLPDLLWGAFLLTGWEQVRIDPGYTAVTPLQFIHYPISHSLLGMAGWSVAVAAAYYSWPTRDTSRHWQAAALVGLAVLSHYLLDLLVHVPDLPVSGDSSIRLGFGLWNHPIATLLLELATLAAGVTVYIAYRSTRHPVRAGRLGGLVTALFSIYLLSFFGPPPPSVTVIAAADIVGLLLLVAFAAWTDRRATPDELAAARARPR
ncbi:MAG TPA: hypothetical protein VJ794_04080 [Gemmatimonadales bacterium]|nr:hypothetical protein [Gemmatimonadales bacterium]